MRIHLICAAFPPFGRGGGPVSSELIARALVAAGHKVEVLTVSEEPYEDHRAGYRVLSLGSPNIYANYWRHNPTWKKLIWHLLENFNPVAFVRVCRRIRQFRPDLVMTVSVENINVATWAAAKLCGSPVIHVIHSYFLLCWRGSMYSNGRNCEKPCMSCRLLSSGRRLASKCVNAIVGETSFVISAHTKRSVFTKARHYVVPAPIDPTGDGTADAIVIPRHENYLTVGYIGYISSGKGVLTLARAARRLYHGFAEKIRFRIAGTGNDSFLTEVRSQFPVQISEFVGWVPAPAFYQSVDVIVVPSIFPEPFGRTSIEPLPYGVPVLAARSGGLPENIEDGVSGLLFTPDDDEELARLLAELASDHARLRALSKGALARAASFNFAAFARTVDHVVAEVQQTFSRR